MFGIEVVCPLGHTQIYKPRTIPPNRPRTQCKECRLWFDIDKGLFANHEENSLENGEILGKKGENNGNLLENNGKKGENHEISMENSGKSHLTYRDQELIKTTENLAKQVQKYGRTIPFSTLQEMYDWLIANKSDLIDALDTALKAYKNYEYDKILRQKQRWAGQMSYLEEL
ncbi:MAG: hypothetical protein ACFFDN_26625 [Candidatus Hodarchaeota archaeon]